MGWHAFWVWVYVNSATVQATSAVLALVGLLFYVRYTKRMMQDSSETKQLTLRPYLVAELNMQQAELNVLVKNVAGPAVRCTIWTRPVTREFKLGSLLRITDVPTQVFGAITKEEPIAIPLARTKALDPILYVIECFDTVNGKYQLQTLQTHLSSGGVHIENLFVIPDSSIPLIRRWVNRMRLFREIRRANKKVSFT